MIRKENAQAAIDLAEELDARNVVVTAGVGTDVGNLVATASAMYVGSHNPFVEANEESNVYAPSAEEIERESAIDVSSTTGGDYGSQHSMLLERSATALADELRAVASFSRNVVRPAIIEFNEQLTQRLARVTAGDGYAPELIQFEYPQPLDNPALVDSMKKFENDTFPLVSPNAGAPEQDVEELVKLIKSGAGQLDAEIDLWLSSAGKAVLSDTYTKVFAANQPVGNLDQLTSREDGANYALAAYLLAQALYDNPVGEVTVALAEWNERIAEVRSVAARRALSYVQQRERDFSIGRLVMGTRGHAIVVNADVYRKFREEGGIDAIIYGAVRSGSALLTLTDLAANAQDYAQSWELKNRQLAATADNRRLAVAREAIYQIAYDMVVKNLADYYPGVGEAAAAVTTVDSLLPQQSLKNIQATVDELCLKDLTDMWALSTRVIAKDVFFFTDAYEILSGIDAICNQNPGITPAEAALMNFAQYLMDYLVEQLTIAR